MTRIDPNINRWARSLVAGLTRGSGLYGVSWANDADLVVVGPVVTMAAGKPGAARGLAVTGDKIAFVGDAASARKRLRPGGRLIALEPGQVVIPGLIDAHVHMLEGGLMLQRCTLDGTGKNQCGQEGKATTKARVLEIIAKYSKAHPELEWIIGSGWSVTTDGFDPDVGPAAADLDTAVADRPAVFYDDNGHSAWLNSLALERAGITACKPDPPRGVIECKKGKKDGPPGGTLREAAVDLVEKVLPETTDGEWLAGLREAQGFLHSLGITMVQDANVNHRMVNIYHKAASMGKLTMKVVAAQLADPGDPREPDSLAAELAKRRDQCSTGRFSASAAKVFVDGVLESRTAALLAPYVGGNERGILNWEARLADLVLHLDLHGMQIHMHAIGDGAVRAGLTALAAARDHNGPSDNRHHMAHLQLVAKADIPRFRALGVIATFNPFWMFADESITRAEAVIGPKRARQLYPLRSIVRTGARFAAGSDWFVSTPNPFLAIQVGTTRQSPALIDGEQVGSPVGAT